MNRSIKLFYTYNVLMNMRFSRGVLMLYSLQLGLTLVEFGILQSVYSFIKMVGEIPSGVIADKFNKKNVLFAGALLNAISSLGLFIVPLYGQSSTFIFLLILFGLDAYASTLSSGTDQALIFDYLSQNNHKDKFMSIISNTQIFGLCMLGISTALGGKLFELGFSIVFFYNL